MAAVEFTHREPTIQDALRALLTSYEFGDPKKNEPNPMRIVDEFTSADEHQITFNGKKNEVGYDRARRTKLRINLTFDTIRDMSKRAICTITEPPVGIHPSYIHHTDPMIVLLQAHIGSYVRVPKIFGEDYMILQVV